MKRISTAIAIISLSFSVFGQSSTDTLTGCSNGVCYELNIESVSGVSPAISHFGSDIGNVTQDLDDTMTVAINDVLNLDFNSNILFQDGFIWFDTQNLNTQVETDVPGILTLDIASTLSSLALTPDVYKVRYNINFGGSYNVNTHFYLNIVDSQVGLSDNNLLEDGKLSVFPSPAKDDVTIKFNSNSYDLPIQVYSLDGQLIQQNDDARSLGVNEVLLNISEYTSGTYIVSVGEERFEFIKM